MKKPRAFSISIGIPTHEFGDSLFRTLDSIYGQEKFEYIKEVIVIVDGKAKSQLLLKRLRRRKLKIIWRKQRRGQSARLNDLFRIATGDYLLLTNDDVILAPNAIKNLLFQMRKNKYGIISGRSLPLSSKTFFERVISVGIDINHHVSRLWSKCDNYLSCNGRLVALSKNFYKQIKIPVKLWNNDAYIFLRAKVSGIPYIWSYNSVAFYKSPTKIIEHLKQSERFQISFTENQKYFKESVKQYYAVPIKYTFRALIKSLVRKPILTISYLGLFFLTRTYTSPQSNHQSGYWHTDQTTKTI